MSKEIAPSRQVAIKTFSAAFKYLIEAGGSLRRRDLISRMANEIKFNEWELELYPKSNTPRWEKIFAFYTIPLVKAGFLQKVKRLWTLTPEGESAFRKGTDIMIDMSIEGYKAWDNSRDKESVSIANDTIAEEIIHKGISELTIDEYEEKATDGIIAFLKSKNAYDFQDCVAALLNSMGYHISYVAPPGRDGGIDIIAYNDPLGTRPPRIVVQVKHRPESTISSDEIQKLVGTMRRDSDVGIFVTSGEFSNPAKNEARQSGKHVELIDFSRFIELWIKYYDKLNDVQKNMLPLYPIYFLGGE